MAFIKETGFSPGARYTVQVRARSKTDQQRVSEWSNAYTFTTSADTVPPMPPSNLKFESEGSSFIAKWDAPTRNADGTVCTDLAGYRLYFEDKDNEESVTREIFTADEGFTLSFDDNREMFGHAKGKLIIHVIAVDQMGNRSDSASESAENPPPADVTGLEVLPGIETVAMSWDENTVDTDLVGYRVYASTSGENFVPAESNLKYSGTSTAFILPTSNPVEHHIKVTAVDIFRLESINPAYGKATPRTTTGADNVPPAEPTNLDVSVINEPETDSLKLTWIDPSDSDLDYIIARYSKDNVDWSYEQAPAGSESMILRNMSLGEDYYIGIKAVDFSGNGSDWVNTDPYPLETERDMLPPNKPSEPTIYSGKMFVLAVHDLLDSNQVALKNVSFLRIYTTGDPNLNNPSDSFPIETISVNRGDFMASGIVNYAGEQDEETYWYVTAVSKNGVESPPSDAVQGSPEPLGGENIRDASIGSAKIIDLQANKITANSAFVNNLYIRSQLTIDDLMGEIVSSDYSAQNSTGWRIDKNGIVINDGAIKAKALEIQTGPNICLPEYSSFEFNKAMYSLEDNSVNPSNLTASVNTIKVDVDADSKYGNQSLKIDWPTGGLRSITLGTATKWTASVDSLQSYIVSMYVKNSSTGTTGYRLEIDTNGGQTYQSDIITQRSGDGFVRHNLVVETEANTTKIKVRIVKTTSGADTAYLDGVQIERQIASSEEPSNYSPPGMTSMSGEGIVTGSIRSSSPAVGIPSQPAWSLNTQGNMQVGDALVRGNLTVGAGSDITNSMVKSSDYQSGTSGWMIRGDGFVEFNNGLFRSDLLLEREVDNVTLRLKASVSESIVYTPGTSTGQVEISQPLITGQSYGFDRTLTTAGWYIPTAASSNKRMSFGIGPTTASNLVIQTTSSDTEGLYSTLPPDNVLLNNVVVGEQIDYKKDVAIRETVGTEMYTYRNEAPTGTIATRSGNVSKTSSLNENFSRIRHSTDFRSPFNPESNERQTSLSEYYSRSENLMEAKSTYIGPAKNLISDPYHYSTHADSWLPFSESRTIQSGGFGHLTSSNTSILSVHPVAYSMLFDSNYKIPAWLVRWGKGTGGTSYMWLNNVATVNASNGSVQGLQAGKTYIFSIFVNSDRAGSATSSFDMTMGMRYRTGTTTADVAKFATVAPGQRAQRLSVSLTIPSSATNVGRATPYIMFPTRASTTGAYAYRDIAFARPQVEEKTWGNDPDPEIASSEAPTAWSSSVQSGQSQNESAIKLVTNSNSDWLYDAYGTYNPDEDTSYAAESVKAYREAPSYLDISFKRKTNPVSTSTMSRESETVYRFSEAGVMYPGAYEPMRPAGLELVYNGRFLSPGTYNWITDTNLLLDSTSHGIGDEHTGDIRLEGRFKIKIMRTGFYAIHSGVYVDNSKESAVWLTLTSNDIEFHSQGAPRIHTHGLNISTVKYFNKGDELGSILHSGPFNVDTLWVNTPRITVVRLA